MSQVYKLKYLRGRKLKVFLAVADRIIPPDQDAPGGGTMLSAGIVDWSMDRMEPSLRKQLLALMMAVEFMGVFFGGKPFTMNGDKAKDRQLRWLESSPVSRLRMGFFGLKTYTSMGYYTREDVWKTIGYDGPVLPDRPYHEHAIRSLCKGEMEVQT